MARTIEEIQQTILQAIQSDTRLAGLNSDSKVSIWRLIVYIIAVASWTLEQLFGLHSTEIDSRLAELKPHSFRWYRNKALAFQYGYDLVADSDFYDNTGIADNLVEASKIIKYAAAPDVGRKVIIKIAGDENGKLQPITADQLSAFAAYMGEIKDAGVDLTIVNYLPDRLYLRLKVYYDPLVLDSQGNSILNGGKPVETAIEQYLKRLPFNGELVLAHLVDSLQAVQGVAIPDLQFVQTSWVDAEAGGYGPVQPIQVKKIPESGYFEVFDYNEITYIANG